MRRCVASVVVAATMLAACGGGTGGTDSTAGADTTVPGGGADTAIDWKKCPNDPSGALLCARFSVPYDWTDASKGSFSLSVVKRPADMRTARIGSMLVNPGGPGFGGTYLAKDAESYFSSDLLARFDIIGWDPRGTGESTPFVDCVDDYDPFFAVDPTPSNAAEEKAAVESTKSFADACKKRSGEILPWVSTNATVRDMDAIRKALGEEKITYFGFSYGSELGAAWATTFPDTVRAAVLDGASDPDADALQSSLDQAKGFEDQVSTFLAACSARTSCVFHNGGDAEGAFDTLMADIDANPITVSPDRAKVNLAVAMSGVIQAMYSSSQWAQLEKALADAQKGDGSGLLRLNDEYFQRNADGTYGNELEAFNAIGCLDDPGDETSDDSDTDEARLKKVAPRLWPAFVGESVCSYWPAEPDRRVDITGKGAGPIVVVGTTGDAATPLASSRKMAQKLEDGRLVVVTADRHTGYGENACVVDAVDTYLITAKVSFSEKSC